MSCQAGNPTFRLLNGYIGWDQAGSRGLDGFGFDDATGLRLKQREPGTVRADAVLAALPPPQLAHGCGRCDWYLVNKGRLLRRDCCAPAWFPVWSEACDPHLLVNAVAVAFRSRRIAVSDAAARKVWIWDNEGDQLVAAINCESLRADTNCDHPNATDSIVQPGPLAFAPWGELLVADAEAKSIWRFGQAGEVRGKLAIALPREARAETIDRLAVSNDCAIWLVTRTRKGGLNLWRAARRKPTPEEQVLCAPSYLLPLYNAAFSSASIEELQKAFPTTGLKAADEKGFCLEECGDEGLPITRCFDWHGERLPDGIKPPTPPKLRKSGKLLTQTIDSGVPHCRWHRVRVDADTPPGTSFTIEVAASEQKNQPDCDVSSPRKRWRKFLAGAPHKLDWQTFDPGKTDFLINQPPGRYLYLRLRLKGDGTKTPVVRSIRLDFPRETSLDFLPSVYRDNPEAEDFTERFMALFDATIADLDRAIERSPALLDAAGVPAEALPWLGGFLDVIFDPAWDADLRRRILQALPALYRMRGTVTGLTETIKLIFGVEPVIQELAAERSWGSVAKGQGCKNKYAAADAECDCERAPKDQRAAAPLAARLGQVRLFGRASGRFRLNSSPLGAAPLRSYGNPDHDPLLQQVFRFRVFVPPQALTDAQARARLERLIASQKPAHTVATLRTGGDGFILGTTSAVGVDTLIAPLPPPVLGGNVRLNRMSIVWHGKHGARSGMKVGENSVVGVKTIIE